MLDPWIIEEIIKREEAQRREQAGVRIELPLDRPGHYEDNLPHVQPPAEERGVVIIDI